MGLDAAYLEKTPPTTTADRCCLPRSDKGELLQPGEYGAGPPPLATRRRQSARSALASSQHDKLPALLPHIYTKLLHFTTEFHHRVAAAPAPGQPRRTATEHACVGHFCGRGKHRCCEFSPCRSRSWHAANPALGNKDGGSGAHADSVQQSHTYWNRSLWGV